MDPTPAKGNSPSYPNGYIKYENAASQKPQGVDPYSGRTLPNSVGLHFEAGIRLIIYNKYALSGPIYDDGTIVIGSTVNQIDECSEFITICFEDASSIKIDMRDEAYSGPEAMQLNVPGEPIVIWN